MTPDQSHEICSILPKRFIHRTDIPIRARARDRLNVVDCSAQLFVAALTHIALRTYIYISTRKRKLQVNDIFGNLEFQKTIAVCVPQELSL